MISPSLTPDQLRFHLNAAHAALLPLHKALIDYAQAVYSRRHGPIGTPSDALNLLIRHPDFAWLRPLTTLIVEIDEAASARPGRPARDPGEGMGLLRQAERLLGGGESGDDFHAAYLRAVQESAEAAAALAEWNRVAATFAGPA